MKMVFRGKEDVVLETIQTPFSENWYQDLKDVPSITLPEKALVGAGMSLCWRMNREDKPVYTEDGKEKVEKMATVSKRDDEELWYLQIVKNFVLPPHEDLAAQPPTGAVMKKPKAEPRDPANIPTLNADDTINLESSPEPLLRTKVQKRKITRRGNLDAFIAKPPSEKPSSLVHAKPSSAVSEDLPPSPPHAPISEQLESTKAAGEDEAEKTAEAGNPKVEKPVEVAVETEKVVVSETTEVESARLKSPKVMVRDAKKEKFVPEDPVITNPVSAPTLELVNVERKPAGDQGASSYNDENDPLRPDETLGDHYYKTYTERKASEVHTPVSNLKKGDTFSNLRVCRDWLHGTFPPSEIKFQEDRAPEQAYHAYLEEAARYTSTTHRIVREWRSMCKEWVAFEASKKKISEDKARVIQMKVTLEADRAKFESELKTEEWSIAGWRRKAEAEAALLSKELKNWREICEKDNNEKMGLRISLNNLKAEVERLIKQDAETEILEQEKAEAEASEVHTCATLALRDKEIEELTSLLPEQEQLKAEVESTKKYLELERIEKAETSRHLAETEDKLENSETARATAESELEPLKSDMLWLKERGTISVSLSIFDNIWRCLRVFLLFFYFLCRLPT
ncbi:hypothetical protein Hanom_Chr07g00642411 [Helianthus anomalus]